MKKVSEKKKRGEVYTPPYIVNIMLDYAMCPGHGNEHILDNSCGDGRFLCEIVRKYIIKYRMIIGNVEGMLKHNLETYIHGMDIDPVAVEKCKGNLDEVAKEFGIENVDWDIRCCDALTADYTFGGEKPFYIIGNPPYVRIHNMDTPLYEFSWCKGMTDLYLAFWQKSLGEVAKGGVVCFITPSSWVTSNAGKGMRKFVYDTKDLCGVIDFKDIQVFDDAQTYVMVSLFRKGMGTKEKEPFIHYCEYNESTRKLTEGEYPDYDDVVSCEGGNVYIDLCPQQDREVLRKVRQQHKPVVRVKNGFATLADWAFIEEATAEYDLNKLSLCIDVYKAGSFEGKKMKCMFPYEGNPLKPIPLEDIERQHPDAYEYLTDRKKLLSERAYDNEWYVFGRSQGLSDLYRYKLAINSIIKNKQNLNLKMVKSGDGIYGGLYMVTDDDKLDEQKQIALLSRAAGLLQTDDFVRYVFSLKKYKRGGFCTFSGKDAEAYLNWKLSEE